MLSLIAGARPNFMKIAPLVPAFRAVGMETRIIHTGQHYDRQMSETFFEELQIPRPDVNLGVGSGSHVWQISEVMRRLEEEFTANRPDAVVVVGDVNSTLAAALTANKLGLPLAHVEAGLRSFDRTMPEETNRIVTDAVSDWLFTSEPSANENLERENIPSERIHLVGNVMIDTLLAHLDRARAAKCHERFGLQPQGYAVLTLHRPSNVDSPDRLTSILRAVHEISARLPVVFPVHPRTRGRIEKLVGELRVQSPGSRARYQCPVPSASRTANHYPLATARSTLSSTLNSLNGYLALDPLGYLDMLGLVADARLVLTDSGGLQEETTALRVPCLTLRENTERPITITVGSNRIIGWKTEDIVGAASDALDGPARRGAVPETWDGRAAERIAAVLKAATNDERSSLAKQEQTEPSEKGTLLPINN